MARILIALNSDERERTIVDYLPPAHEVMTLEKAISTEQVPDICIVDLARWDEVANWTNGFSDEQIYCLLLTSTDEIHRIPHHIQEHIHDLITQPLQSTELQIRLRSLLRMKDRSEQQRRIYETLAITNKALESTSDAIVIADNDGVSIYANPAFLDVFGYSVTELNVGGIPNMLFQFPAVGTRIFNVVRQEGSWNGEVELKTKSGDIVPFLLNIDTIRDDQGMPIGIISICTDISQQKLLNAVQREQRIVAEAQLDTLRVLTSTLNPTEVFERILDNISQVVPNDAANIILVEDGKTQLVDRDDYSDKSQLEGLRTGEVPVHHYDDLRQIMDTNAPLIIPNTKQYLATNDDMRRRTPWLKSHIGIPIHLQDQIIGFLNVDSVQPGLFTDEHAEQLQLFAEQAAIAIHNARLHERAQKLATMEERQRLARNLHDAVSQTLFSASIIADALPQLWDKRPEDVPPRLEQIRNLNRGALAEMRTLLLELYPERLLDTPISELMNQLAEAVLGQARIHVKLEITENLELPSDIHEAVYYIAQEAMNNAARHAEASQVTVQLYENQRQLTLKITDNGRGFDPQAIPSTSLGLSNIRERARATGANLDISAEIGKGTQISLYWSN